MNSFVCIHAHFYQPPRENPWLEEIEIQDSAYPYHDWNERINSECYAPNSASRLFDEQGRIVDIVSNYAKISFDLGPTLLSWMETHATEAYKAILEADRLSTELRSGHGNAIAQAYNHMIMPLANARDKRTQVIWGIKDFRHRFGRLPEGMWLPETAVDLETMDILAQNDIKFTVLAPHQAAKFRELKTDQWVDVAGGIIDTTRAYVCTLPSGRTISIFFNDGPISRAVAFEGLLNKSEDFASRLLSGLSNDRQWPQLLNIATDGESYGHHHKFGDMALCYALYHIEQNKSVNLTNYGEYLENNPPLHEVQIFENTSWSCAHGVERWRNNCGCNTGANPNWNQEWRAPLRSALDWLRDDLANLYETEAKQYLKDPWSARDAYIGVILDRSDQSLKRFFEDHALKEPLPQEESGILRLMEIQRHAMLMFTSCGWFFDELSGIETVQIIQYAGRAVQLAGRMYDTGFEDPFQRKLSEAKSNIPKFKDGGLIHDMFVKTTEIDLKNIAIHYALSSLIREYGEKTRIYSCSVIREDYTKMQAGEARLAVGKTIVTSEIIRDSETVSFCVLYLGGHLFHGGLQTYDGDEKYSHMKQNMLDNFERGDIVEIMKLMVEFFGMNNYSLRNLFRDEQRKITAFLTDRVTEEFERSCDYLYNNNRALMSFIQDMGTPLPRPFIIAFGFAFNLQIKKILQDGEIDSGKIKDLINDIKKWDLPLDTTSIEFELRRKLEGMITDLLDKPTDSLLLSHIRMAVELARMMPVEMNLWHVQNIYFSIAKTTYKEVLPGAGKENGATEEWVNNFKSLGEMLLFNISAVLGEN
jgi:alpha-amylase/alpha-mannosidase (GH57 family)